MFWLRVASIGLLRGKTLHTTDFQYFRDDFLFYWEDFLYLREDVVYSWKVFVLSWVVCRSHCRNQGNLSNAVDTGIFEISHIYIYIDIYIETDY